MNSIKTKMMSMVQEKEYAKTRLEEAEREADEYKEKIKASEEEHQSLLKKINQADLEFDKASEELSTNITKLEEAHKASANSELEVGGLQRRINLTETELEQMESRLKEVSAQLAIASHNSDESEKGRKTFEASGIEDDEKISNLEKQFIEAQQIADEADKRYDESARRFAIMEVDLERTEDRADAAETKLAELEEELKVVGNNMKMLEISEQEALSREESYDEQIREMSTRLKEAEERADLGDRTMTKLQKEVDRLTEECNDQKEKYKNISEELEQTLNDLQGYE